MDGRRRERDADGGALLASPPGLVVTRFSVAGQEFLALEWRSRPPTFENLSSAEREVVRLVLEGRSNAAIARHRGSAQGTVAKQVASVFRKLGVHSRGELCAGAPHVRGREPGWR